ncbi:MAG: UDP-glucose 4-epimerase GalE [Desulfovibrio sp.]
MGKVSQVLITGGAGYIGSHVNKYLHLQGVDTVVLDNLSAGHKDFVKWGDFIQADLGDPEELDEVFREYSFDAVMHFASSINVGESVVDPELYYHNNVTCTLNLLSAMKKYNVKNIVFSSTCATYGTPQYIPLDEDHPQWPVNPYGWSKLMDERMMLDFAHAHDMNCVFLRYFNAAGADLEGEVGEWHEPETHLIPLILDAAMGKRDSIKIFGGDYDTPDGTCIRDYIHVTDLAEAHRLAMEYLSDGGKPTAFNLGNGQGFSVKEMIEAARKVTGVDIKAVMEERRAGDPARLVGSSAKAREVLGWEPQYTNIEDIIRSAWNWHNDFFTIS